MADVIVGPEVIAGYNSLFRAQLSKTPKPTDKPKFDLVSLLTHESVKTPQYQALVATMIEAATARFGKLKFEEMVREGVFESPFKKDIGSKGLDPARFAVRIASSANEQYPPLVLDARRRGPDGKALPITDPREIYQGVRLIVSYAARAYGGLNTGYSPGVKLDLRNVMKIGDGDRLSGAGPDGSEFGGIVAPPPDEAAGAADMAALLG